MPNMINLTELISNFQTYCKKKTFGLLFRNTVYIKQCNQIVLNLQGN